MFPESFVVVRFEGGLGNQMFQYAAGRAVALSTGRRLLLDPSAIARGPGGRCYELASFQIAGEPVRWLKRTMIRAQIGARVPAILRSTAGVLSGRRWTLLRDEGRGCDERLFATPGDLVLQGFWQTVGYVERDSAVVDQLRHDFGLREPMPARVAALAAEMSACESVCVHVRRGDYVSNARIAAAHGALSLDYYAAAVERLAARVAAPSFFVFSDDLAWVRGHLKLPGPTQFVDAAAGLSPAVEQRLMASCRHFIIANSTFSWWAAWLGEAPDKIVIAPQRWFATAPSPEGLIPSKWTRV